MREGCTLDCDNVVQLPCGHSSEWISLSCLFRRATALATSWAGRRRALCREEGAVGRLLTPATAVASLNFARIPGYTLDRICISSHKQALNIALAIRRESGTLLPSTNVGSPVIYLQRLATTCGRTNDARPCRSSYSAVFAML